MEQLEDRLEKLAASLRQQGLVTGPERDLMVDAAEAIRAQRSALVTISRHVNGAREATRNLRAILTGDES